MRYLKVSLILLFLWCKPVWSQFEIPDKPAIQTSVYDYTNLLSDQQKNELSQKLVRYSDSTSTQIVITIISTTKGEDINYLGANWGQKWGIGQEGKDNGILIILAQDDRKIAISTGYGAEGSLTDAFSKRIIENIILPEFRTGNFYGGLDKGSDVIFQVLNGEFKEDRTFDNNEGFPFSSILPFIIFIVILFILWSRKNDNNNGSGGKRRGLSPWDMIILSNMGRSNGSGGFGSSSGGGSFGSGGFGGGFGGGGFGGGGASGGW